MKKFIATMILLTLMGSAVFAQGITFKQDAFNSAQPATQIAYQWVKDVPGLPPLSGASSDVRYLSSTDNYFAELFFDIFFSLWVYDLFVITWDDYPYQDGKYINFLDFETGINAMFDDELPSSGSSLVGSRGKPYRFVLDGSFTAFPDEKMYAAEARFEGFIWKFFGPVFEVMSLSDTPFTLTDPNNAYIDLRLGGQLSLLQTNFLSMTCHFQWTHWYGRGEEWSHNDGMNFGMIFRSYPAKPIVIEWRFNIQDLNTSGNDAPVIYESHLQLGCMLDSPLELYGAWKFLSNDYSGHYYNGFTGGVRYHF